MCGVSFVLALAATGTTADERIAKLEAQFAAFHSRFAALEEENKELKAQLAQALTTAKVSAFGGTSLDMGRRLSHISGDTTTCCRWTRSIRCSRC